MESIDKYIEKADNLAKVILTGEGEVSDEDKKTFKALNNGEYAEWRRQHIHLFNKQNVWPRIKLKLKLKGPKVIQLTSRTWWSSVAAVLLIGVMGTIGYFVYDDVKNLEQSVAIPGKSIAYLEVDQKKRIDLSLRDTLMLFDKTHAKLDSGKIVYTSEQISKVKGEYHKINVPRNGEFYVELSDGTKVWVNSESTLGFHTQFSGKTRIVELQGEAYFEVAKNPDKPFIVKTSKVQIKVLGTKFNVKAYGDDDYTYATLNEGKVRVSCDSKKEILRPNEQLLIQNSTSKLSKRKVDASVFSAWAKGRFVFKDERLEDILTSLSRWYDVSVFFTDSSLKERRFSISIDRYDDIKLLLDQMELTNHVHFELNKGAVIVKNRR